MTPMTNRTPSLYRFAAALALILAACDTEHLTDDPEDVSADLADADDADDAAGIAWAGKITVISSGPTCTPGLACGEPAGDSWCDDYEAMAIAHKIPALYVGIMRSKCEKNLENGCYECWDLANYCAQVGTSCTNVEKTCTCLAEKWGEI